MDIDLLSKMVKELILDTDRVTLPGLGSFVAEIVPATFSDKGYTINPPYRRLYFRAKPDEGSELISFYASSNNVQPDMAERIIRDFLSELKNILHEKKIVVFPGLGRLRATKENNLFFVADEDLDIYPEGFGLEPISLKTHHESREQVAAVVSGLKSIIAAPEIVEPAKPEVPQQVEVAVEVPEPEVSVQIAPEPQTIPQPEVTVEAVAAPEPVAEPEPVKEFITVEVIPEAEPETVVEPETETLAEPEVEPETALIPEQESVSIPDPVAEPEPVDPKPEVAVELRSAPSRQEQVKSPEKPSAARKIFKAVAWAAAVAAVLLVTFTVVARMNPGIMDSLLYTPEELEIVKTL